MQSYNSKEGLTWTEEQWDRSIIPALEDFIKIPNQSPLFDPEWMTNGLQEQAVDHIVRWIREQNVPGLTLEVVKHEGRTPLVLIEVEATTDDKEDTILLYGHLDKQPPMHGWEDGLDAHKPVLRDGKLYGRGGADDGYAAFAAITAIQALKKQGVPHARCVVVVEACEESGSRDLPHYIQALLPRIKSPSLVICLDSGCGNYEQLWLTTSLRGTVVGNLKAEILTEGVHSGSASGIVASSFRIVREVLNRLEDAQTGIIVPPFLHTEIPTYRIEETKQAANVLGDLIHREFPWKAGARPVGDDLVELFLNKTWRPALSVTGAAGLPALENSGNVLRPYTTLKLSLRLPPTINAKQAGEQLKKLLEENPPYGATVSFEIEKAGTGWESPKLADWLSKSLEKASRAHFDKSFCCMGEGGSIPFMGMLGELFPEAQFMITGVLGPKSNAHGPNEFLHIGMGKGITSCVSSLIADHAQRNKA
jgi:acetylornithine deacetylase/succinyl-diaminopimelate desuccinylase-like protein